MDKIRRLWPKFLTEVKSVNRRFLLSGVADINLIALADEYLANERAVQDLLKLDNRDTDDIPSFGRLADRQAELVVLIAGTPAQGFSGLLGKARAVRLRPFQVGYDGVTILGWSLAGDVLRLLGKNP